MIDSNECRSGSFGITTVSTEAEAVSAELANRDGSGQACWRVMLGTKAHSELFAQHCQQAAECPYAVIDQSRPIPEEVVWGVPPRD